MGGHRVSTIRTVRLALTAFTLALVGCASTGPSTEVKRLQAQNAYERGLGYNKEGQPAPALSAFQEAVSLDPTHAVYRDRLGFMLLELGQLDQAIETLSKAVELDPRR